MDEGDAVKNNVERPTAPDSAVGAHVIHEEVLQYFEQAESQATSWDPLIDIAQLREQGRREALRVRGELEPARVEETRVAGVPSRIYRTLGDEQGDGVLIWIHGGGWMQGDLDCYEGVARALANRTCRTVLAPDYRLAPEHPFPAGLDDVWEIVVWATKAFGRVAVAGDSSGANLAAAAAIKARDLGIELAAQILVYPVLDSRAETTYKLAFRRDHSPFANQPAFGQVAFDRIAYIWQHYVQDPALRNSPYAAPLSAESLSGVAPAFILTAEHDILRAEAEDFEARLRKVAVPVTTTRYAGQIHGFLQMRAVMADAHSALEEIGAWAGAEFARPH